VLEKIFKKNASNQVILTIGFEMNFEGIMVPPFSVEFFEVKY
jgi:hypothetical protein